MAAETVIIGKIVGFYGVRGWFKLLSYTDPRENILGYKSWQINVQGQWQVQKVESAKQHGKGIVAKLVGFDNRDDVAAFMGCDIAIESTQLPKLAENEYYWRDLQGLEVIDAQARLLGRVDYLIDTGANDVLVVVSEDSTETLIPYILGDVVKRVDIENGKLHVDWDLTES